MFSEVFDVFLENFALTQTFGGECLSQLKNLKKSPNVVCAKMSKM